MTIEWCETCGEVMWESHVCPPAWDVWDPEEGDRAEWGSPWHAIDAETAAERWAEGEDGGGDYSIVGGADVVVCVAKVGSDEVKRFNVSGEVVPEYSAEVIE